MRSCGVPSASGSPSSVPFQIADMAGLDTYARVLETLQRELGERFYVPAMLREQLAQGRVGTKGGAGFSDYTDERRDRLLLDRDRYYAALSKLLATMAAPGGQKNVCGSGGLSQGNHPARWSVPEGCLLNERCFCVAAM